MADLPDPKDPGSLLEHAAWVRRLAGALVRDPHDAEDVAQDTWLATLGRPPRDVGSARSWLRTVLANVAARQARKRRARARREATAARDRSEPSAADLVERAALLRLVVGEVEHLQDPYRTVLLLRYLEGLSPSEIARRRSVPAGSVRAQLTRGLDRLRARLRQRLGDGWPRALVPLVVPAVVPKAAAAGIGVTIVSVKKSAAVVCALLLVFAGVWHALKTPDSAPIPDPVSPRDPGSAASSSPATEGGRGVVTERFREPRTSAAGESETPRRLRGRVIDEDGHPIVGAEVLVFPTGLVDSVSLTAEVEEATDLVRRARTNAQGGFEFAAHPGAAVFTMCAAASGFAPTVETPVRPEETTTLVLRPAATLGGRTLDMTGAPLPGVRVRWSVLVDGVLVTREATSAENGAYQLENLPAPRFASTVVLEAWREGYSTLVLTEAEHRIPKPQIGDALTFDVVLVRGTTVTGRVLDGDSGQPLPGIQVRFLSFLVPDRESSGPAGRNTGRPSPSTRSGSDGTYCLRGVPARGFHPVKSRVAGGVVGRVVASGPEWSEAWQNVATQRDGDVIERNLVCWPAVNVQGRVVDGAGRPQAGVSVWAIARALGSVQVTARTRGDGSYVLHRVPARNDPPAKIEVSANPRGSRGLPPGTSSHSKLEIEIRPGGVVHAPDLVLEPLPRIRLLAFSDGGRPVPGARSRALFTSQQRPTDVNGRADVLFTPGANGVAQPLVVEADGFAPTVVTAVTPSIENPPEVRVRLEPGHGLLGRVVWQDGSPVANAMVEVADGRVPIEKAMPSDGSDGSRPESDPWRVYRRNYVYSSFMTGLDGRFRFKDLPKGDYHIAAWLPVPGRDPQRVVAQGIATGSASITLTIGPRPAVEANAVSGSIVAADGTPTPSFDVRLEGRGWLQPTRPRFGWFRFDDVPDGQWTLVVDAEGYVAERRTLQVESDMVVEVRLQRGVTVHGRVAMEPGASPSNPQVLFKRPGVDGFVRADIRADGSYRATGLAPGRYVFMIVYPNAGPWDVAYAPLPPQTPVIKPGDDDKRVDFRVVRGGWLSSLVVKDIRLQGAARSRLTLVDQQGRIAWEWANVRNGGYTHPLAEGTWSARLEIDGRKVAESPFSITKGEKVRVVVGKR